MAQIVSNEIPSGVIDSSNKLFSTLYNIQSITSLIVDWVEYFDFTIIGDKTITLVDAPTLSIYVDYIADWYSPYSNLNISTLVDLRGRARQEYTKIDPNGKIWDNNILDIFVNESYTKIQRACNYDLQENENTYTLPITGASEYSLPTDFVRLEDIKANGGGLLKKSKQYVNGLVAVSSTPQYYYLFKNKIGFYPAPTGTDTIEMIYKKKLPKITDTQDSELPDDYDEVIGLYACYLMCLSVEKVQKAQIVLAQYIKLESELFAMGINNDENISFWLERC